MIIIVSFKCENSVSKKEFLREIELIYVFAWFTINNLLLKRF